MKVTCLMKKKMMMMKMTDDGQDKDEKDGYNEGRPLVASIGKSVQEGGFAPTTSDGLAAAAQVTGLRLHAMVLQCCS